MNRERRTEIILKHMKCLLRYFPVDNGIENDICKFCSDYSYCVNTWQPWLEKEIKEILDSEFKVEVGAHVRFLSGQLKGQKGRITKIGAVHNNIGCYCWIEIKERAAEVWVRYPEQIEIIK